MSSAMKTFVDLLKESPADSETIARLLDQAGWAEWEQRYGSKEQLMLLDTQKPLQITHTLSSLLVAYRCTDGPSLFRLGFSRTPSANRVHDKSIEGDLGNAAAFFVERYYHLFDYRGQTVSNLLPLAAHCVLMAHELNCTGVKGLEIAVCTQDRCEMVKDLDSLTIFSKGLDSQIAEMLRHSEV